LEENRPQPHVHVLSDIVGTLLATTAEEEEEREYRVQSTEYRVSGLFVVVLQLLVTTGRTPFPIGITCSDPVRAVGIKSWKKPSLHARPNKLTTR
jgi:hypothetical protein